MRERESEGKGRKRRELAALTADYRSSSDDWKYTLFEYIRRRGVSCGSILHVYNIRSTYSFAYANIVACVY